MKRYNLPKKTELDFRNRCVSFLHGSLALFLTAYQVFFLPRICGDQTTQIVYLTLANSGGYFLYDIVCMKIFGLLDLDMLVHHLLCAGGIVGVLCAGSDAAYVVGGLFLAEVSNPPMHVRMMLRNVGKRYTLAYEYAEYCYFFMFFVGRMLWGQPYVYDMVMNCDSMHILGKFVASGVMAQSY
jgi:hypothetical protein